MKQFGYFSKITLIAFLSSFFIVFISHAKQPNSDLFQKDIPIEIVEKLDLARESRLNGDFDTAIKELGEIVKQRPDFYRAQYNLALAAAEAERPETASEAFQKAEQIRNNYNIDDPTFYNSFGWFALLNDQREEADRLFHAAAAEQKKMSKRTLQRLYNNTGVLALKQSNLQRARACFSEAEKLGSDLARRQMETLTYEYPPADEQQQIISSVACFNSNEPIEKIETNSDSNNEH